MSDYDRVAAAIDYITNHVREQPALDEIAAYVHLSPYHFQRLFSRWAGISPKRFLQTLTLEHAKKILVDSTSIMDASETVGLSSPARLHDHFVMLEAMTPGEYKSQGENLEIRYGIHECPFGEVFLATTKRGVCHLIFLDQDQRQTDIDQAIKEIRYRFQNAGIENNQKLTASLASEIFSTNAEKKHLPVFVTGTNFQIKVWKALLQIPRGQLSTYGTIAKQIGNPKASRAVGSAVGANPISFLIPCHRVIRSSGVIGNYRWGKTRKKAMLIWES